MLHVHQLVALARHRRLHLSASVTELLPVAETPAAIQRLLSGEGNPVRLVLRT